MEIFLLDMSVEKLNIVNINMEQNNNEVVLDWTILTVKQKLR